MSCHESVLVTEHLAEPALAWLRERCEVRIGAPDGDGAAALESTAGLVVRTYTIVDQSLLQRAPSLRVVGRAGVGLDNINVAACRARGVEVVHTPDANTQAVVEYVLWLIGDAMRPRVALDDAVDAATWKQLRAETVGRNEVGRLTLGILGLGRIGKRLAVVARALGMRVVYNDLLDIPEAERAGAEPVDAEALFALADILSIHIDGRAENRGFVDDHLLRLMKPEVVLLNTSRGFVIDHEALASFLEDYPDALALLDVHEPEPFTTHYPLLGLANARLYPHLASRTETAMENMSWVVRDVVAVLEGRRPEHPAP